MPEVSALDDRLNRLTNRLMRRFPGPTVDLATDVPIVSFTFDDVPDTALGNGAAILEAHGARGTFYVAGGLAGQVEPGRTLISPEGIAELAARGHEVACHTFSHANVRKLGRRRLAAELDRNGAFLGAATGRTPVNFAFPYNAMSPLTKSELRRRFRSARGGGEGINRHAVDPLLLRAVEMRQPESYARSLTARIDEVAAAPGWLIFFVHDVAAAPTPYGVTPETFAHLVGHAVARGCAVLTVDAALDRFGVARAA